MKANKVRTRTVLVLSGGGLQGLALLQPLADVPGLRLLVADTNREHLASFVAHGYFQAPPLAQREVFEHFVIQLCREQAVDDIFPATGLELEVLSELAPRLSSVGVAVWVSSLAVLALNRDKFAFYEWLQEAGLAALPATMKPTQDQHAGRWIGKPRGGWGGRGVVIAENAAAAAAAVAGAPNELVWQPCLDSFEEFSVDFAVNAAGEVSPWVPRRRIRTLGGFAVLCEPGGSKTLMAEATATIDALAAVGARGMLNLQLLLDSDGRAWISDLNARVGTSMPMSVAMGVDPLRWLMQSSDAPTPDTAAASDGTRRVLRLMTQRLYARVPLRQVRGLVFDLDDTLIDQKAWMLAKLEMLWSIPLGASLSLPPKGTFLACMLQIIEEGNRATMFDAFAAQHGLADDARQALIDGYRQQLPTTNVVYPDVAGMLLQLRKRGFVIGLLSDNPAQSQRDKLACTELAQALDAVVLTGDLGHAKPSSQAFEAVANALNLSAHQLVMVGDNMARDIAGSLAAGFAHAFYIQREGAFFNHAESAWRSLLPAGWTKLNTLAELSWYLEEALT